MIWTIYNHGTGGSSLKTADKAEIVNLFGNNDRNQQFHGKIITEGAGSIGDPQDLVMQFTRLSSGDYAYRPQQGKSNSLSRGLFGGAAGGGVQENVQNTLEFIRALNLAGKKPDQINMIGWSRGAVTCIRLAYKLSQSQDANLRNIPINIFAVDPVAGAGHNSEVDATTVNGNVKNYFATLATGEKRRFFKPIAAQRLTINDPGNTRSWILPVPGHHSDTAKNNNNIGKLVFNLAYRFLTAVGTPVAPMRSHYLSDAKAWPLYEEVMIGKAQVHTTSTGSKIAMGGVGYDRTEAKVYAAGDALFPNYHAEMVFQGAYPVCYEAYFSPRQTPKRNTQAWALTYSPAIVAEQKRNNMSQGMINLLQGLKPGAAPVAVASDITNMISALTLVG